MLSLKKLLIAATLLCVPVLAVPVQHATSMSDSPIPSASNSAITCGPDWFTGVTNSDVSV